MPIHAPLEPASLLASLTVVAAALALHAILAVRAFADLRDHGGRVRVATVQAWQVLIAIVIIVGPIAYLAFGRTDG